MDICGKRLHRSVAMASVRLGNVTMCAPTWCCLSCRMRALMLMSCQQFRFASGLCIACSVCRIVGHAYFCEFSR